MACQVWRVWHSAQGGGTFDLEDWKRHLLVDCSRIYLCVGCRQWQGPRCLVVRSTPESIQGISALFFEGLVVVFTCPYDGR